MLRNITRNVPLNKNILLKRYNIPQAILHVRYKQNIAEVDNDIEDSRPIKYSTSKAANMRIDEYRIPYKERPSYQGPIIALSFIIFLVYFCILREENDIDEMIYIDLNSTLKQCEKQNKETVKLTSK